MSVYVTVKMCQGLLADVHVFLSRQGAKEEEGRWLAEHEINTREDREAKAGNGTAFHLVEADLRP